MTPDELAKLPVMLRITDVRAVADIGRSVAYELVRTGRIPSVRLGKAVRVPKHQLMELLGIDGGTGTTEAPLTEYVSDTSRKSGPRQQAARQNHPHVEHES